MTTVSVLLPVFNREPFLRQAIESILAQSFAEFELLILDDGSTDASLGTIKSLTAVDPRIRFESRANRGLVATLNELLDKAKGDFIARMDADDVAAPERFARQLDQCAQDARLLAVGSVRGIASATVKPAVSARRIFGPPLLPPSAVARRRRPWRFANSSSTTGTASKARRARHQVGVVGVEGRQRANGAIPGRPRGVAQAVCQRCLAGAGLRCGVLNRVSSGPGVPSFARCSRRSEVRAAPSCATISK